MPILELTIVGEGGPEDAARRLAGAASAVLGAPPEETWVQVKRVDARDFAGGASASPALVRVLRYEVPVPEERARSVAALTDAIAKVLGRARGDVHVVIEPAGAGRVAFGGELVGGPPRHRVSSGAKWESIVGYCRAMRVGDLVWVTGTTAVLPDGTPFRDGDAYAQAKLCFANIERALAALGGSTRDVVRTRMFVTDIARDWSAIGRAHAESFGDVRPATTMVEVRKLIEDWMLVEIEADAYLGGGAG